MFAFDVALLVSIAASSTDASGTEAVPFKPLNQHQSKPSPVAGNSPRSTNRQSCVTVHVKTCGCQAIRYRRFLVATLHPLLGCFTGNQNKPPDVLLQINDPSMYVTLNKRFLPAYYNSCVHRDFIPSLPSTPSSLPSHPPLIHIRCQFRIALYTTRYILMCYRALPLFHAVSHIRDRQHFRLSAPSELDLRMYVLPPLTSRRRDNLVRCDRHIMMCSSPTTTRPNP